MADEDTERRYGLKLLEKFSANVTRWRTLTMQQYVFKYVQVAL